MADFGGTSGNDSFVGGVGNETLAGLAGNDTLSGDAGNDTIDGGAGNDSVLGGDGDDVLIQFSGATSPETYDGGAGVDTLRAVGAFVPANNIFFAGVSPGSVLSVERLELASGAGQTLVFQTAIGQFGVGKIAPNTELVGGAGADILSIQAGPAGSYALPDFTLTNWTTTSDVTTSDRVILSVAPNSVGNYTLSAAATHGGIQVLTA